MVGICVLPIFTNLDEVKMEKKNCKLIKLNGGSKLWIIFCVWREKFKNIQPCVSIEQECSITIHTYLFYIFQEKFQIAAAVNRPGPFSGGLESANVICLSKNS